MKKINVAVTTLIFLVGSSCTDSGHDQSIANRADCISYLRANGYSDQAHRIRDLRRTGIVDSLYRMSRTDLPASDFCVGYKEVDSRICIYFLPIEAHAGGDFGYCISKDYGN
jgi:hypothetical protein